MSFKERVVFLDRAAFTPDDLPIPSFEHNWSEYPETEPANLVPRLFWPTTVITHAAAIGQLHKLIRVIVTRPAGVDEAACKAEGILVHRFQANDASESTLVGFLETVVSTTQNN